MKERLKERLKVMARGLALPLVVVIFMHAFVRFDSEQLQWREWTGFGADEEITQTDKLADPNCDISNQNCVIQERTRVRKIVSGKTLWDVLSLLGVPFALALLGFRLQQVQQKRADEGIKEEVLQAFFDRISELLIDKNIIAIADQQNKSKSVPSANDIVDESKELVDTIRDVIRARTLSILRRLEGDGERKTSIIRFLSDTEIIAKFNLDLSDADLSETDLGCIDFSTINLKNANLMGANLIGNNLSNAYLNHTNLSNAHLGAANLRNTDLSDANLGDAYLQGADLSFADLSFADLSNAQLTNANLTSAKISLANLRNTELRNVNLSSAKLVLTTLSSADLSDANLSGAIFVKTDLSTTKNLTQEQLEGESPPYLCKVKLPPGITIDPDRDCKQIAQIWKDRNPERFKTIEAVQQYIDELL